MFYQGKEINVAKVGSSTVVLFHGKNFKEITGKDVSNYQYLSHDEDYKVAKKCQMNDYISLPVLPEICYSDIAINEIENNCIYYELLNYQS